MNVGYKEDLVESSLSAIIESIHELLPLPLDSFERHIVISKVADYLRELTATAVDLEDEPS